MVNFGEVGAVTASSTSLAAEGAVRESTENLEDSMDADREPKKTARSLRKGLSFALDPLDQPHPTWPTLTVREVNEFREIFDVVDCETPRGAIDKSEIQKLMGSLGLKPTEEELIKMIQEFRPEYKSGDECEISFEEFVQLMAKKAEPPVNMQEAEKAFQIFRAGRAPPGYVRTEDLLPALTKYPSEPVTEAQARHLLATLDPNKTGLVNYEEYLAVMLAG